MPSDGHDVLARSREMIDRSRISNDLTRRCLTMSRQAIAESRRLLGRLGRTTEPVCGPGMVPPRP